MVVGNYGNSKHWIIEDIQFDVNFCKTCVAPESKVTIDEYYDKHYAVKIKNLKQPIIRSSNGKNQPQVILIPELLFLTGIPNDFDERKRRQISEHSIIQPEEKLKKIQSLINRFNSNTESCSMKSI